MLARTYLFLFLFFSTSRCLCSTHYIRTNSVQTRVNWHSICELFQGQFSTLCIQLHNLGPSAKGKCGALVQKLLNISRWRQQDIKRMWVLHNCACHTFMKPPADDPGTSPAHLCEDCRRMRSGGPGSLLYLQKLCFLLSLGNLPGFQVLPMLDNGIIPLRYSPSVTSHPQKKKVRGRSTEPYGQRCIM